MNPGRYRHCMRKSRGSLTKVSHWETGKAELGCGRTLPSFCVSQETCLRWINSRPRNLLEESLLFCYGKNGRGSYESCRGRFCIQKGGAADANGKDGYPAHNRSKEAHYPLFGLYLCPFNTDMPLCWECLLYPPDRKSTRLNSSH